MRLVYSFRIDQNDKVIYSTLKEMSKISKDLYNQALFEVKKNYEEIGEILSYSQLDKIIKTKKNLEDNINYHLLPAKVAQQTLMLVEQNIQSFFKAKADYKEHPEKYLACPQFPNFLDKNGHFVLVFTNQQAKITEDGKIQLTRDVAIHIPEEEFSKYQQYFLKKEGFRIVPKFNQVRIVPKFNAQFFNIEIIYDKSELSLDLDIERVASLDIGVNNLITLVDNYMDEEDRKPIIINGKPIKSINQFYNKKRAEILSKLSQTNQRSSKELSTLQNPTLFSSVLIKVRFCNVLREITDWRNEKINDYMHKASRFVINHCKAFNIGHIVIGKNDGWKQEINIGSRNNQNFVFIPFNRLIQQIQYKAKLVGIEVTTTEEGYTSKCSALDLETIGKHEDHAYAGKRVKRGLFRTALGILINADVNGALNILRKVIGDIFLKPFIEKVARLIPSRGYLCYPSKVYF